MYDFYPESYGPADNTEEQLQPVTHEAGLTGGMGFDSDYGQTMDDFMRAGREARRRREETEQEQQRTQSQRPLGFQLTQKLVERG